MASRREFLLSLAALGVAPAWAAEGMPGLRNELQLAACWQAGNNYQTGILARSWTSGVMDIAAAIDVPTRAHGLLLEAGGTVLTIARRPGTWILRWDRSGRAVAWHWSEANRAFAGHVLASADGRTLYTTEMDLESGAGLIGVRNAANLEKRAEWPTHGIDPHQLLWDVTQPGCLIVANGGVPTRPETGRLKHDLERMDSSLVRIDGKTGELLGQWRLSDQRLSLRHLAWNTSTPNEPVLGIALQAEHDGAEEKAAAPVLALFDGRAMRAASAPQPLAGYGGDIAAWDRNFAVSCPRVHGVGLYNAHGEWQGFKPLQEACALAATSNQTLVGGASRARDLSAVAPAEVVELDARVSRLDNHWIAL